MKLFYRQAHSYASCQALRLGSDDNHGTNRRTLYLPAFESRNVCWFLWLSAYWREINIAAAVPIISLKRRLREGIHIDHASARE